MGAMRCSSCGRTIDIDTDMEEFNFETNECERCEDEDE